MSDPTPPSAPALELSHIAKAFGAVIALTNGTLRLHRDTIHALVGENGAGKSTLLKIIAGLYQRDAGDLLLDGEVVDFRSTAEAKVAGIAVIYQEPTLFPDLSVTENIFMGRQPRGALGVIDRRAMRTEALALFERLGGASTPTARRSDCRSPISRSSRSPKPSRSTRACSSWTSRPPPSPWSRSSACSRWPGRCGMKAARL